MHSSCILVLLAIVVSCASASCTKKANPKTYLFPKDFRWSTATSSYQIEGATREDGRGLSIWDTFSRKPGKIRDNSTGDVAAGSYRKFREDVQLINKIGLKEYRFSFAWSRILPTGRADVVNPAGVKYYHSVIDELIANDIRPVVTLYHWDLPQALQDRGGWLNREIISWFTEYAKFCFHEFGSKVKTWITVNEPIVHSVYGHCGRVEEHAPGGSKENCDWAPYLAGHHMLLAHAHAYRYFHKPGNLQGGGKVGISNHVMFPIAEGPQDQKATDLALDFALHWFNHPIFKEDYPPKMKSWIRHLSRKEARSTSRLPSFTADELEMLSGSADFLGLNYYITRVVRTSSTPKASMLGADVPAELLTRTEWMPVGDERSWIRSYPEGLENLLEVIKNEYDNPEVLITENGCMDTPGEGLNDITRTRYLKGHMAAVSRAISKGSNVTGYTLWSLIDNFEWADGYTNLFGIHKVDFNDKTLRRSRKHSANFYEKVVQNNVVIIDQGSESNFKEKCGFCKKEGVKFASLDASLPDHIRELFTPMANSLEECNKLVTTNIRFQQGHRDRLMNYFKQKSNAFEKLKHVYLAELEGKNKRNNCIAALQNAYKKKSEEVDLLKAKLRKNSLQSNQSTRLSQKSSDASSTIPMDATTSSFATPRMEKPSFGDLVEAERDRTLRNKTDTRKIPSHNFDHCDSEISF